MLRAPIPMEEMPDWDAYWTKTVTWADRRADLFLPFIDRSGNGLLDLGCGDCRFLLRIKERFPGMRLMGVDVSRSSIEILSANGIEGRRTDITSPDLESLGAWDYVAITEVLEHLPDAERVMEAIWRRQPRRVFVTVPNIGCVVYRLRLLWGRFPIVMIQHHIKEHVRHWTVRDFIEWCKRLRYKVVQVVPVKHNTLGASIGLHRWPGWFSCQVGYVLEPILEVADRVGSAEREVG